MELPCSRSMISSGRSLGCRLHPRRKLKGCSFGTRTVHVSNYGFFHFAAIYSKSSNFRDYQGYARPSRLFPATEVKEISGDEEKPNPFIVGGCSQQKSLFKIKIQTSRMYDSGFSDVNAGLLLCIIDENGDSILQRIPTVGTTSTSSSSKPEAAELLDPNVLHFQRGSVDEFTFEGQKLERIKALWISLESGQWRLGGVSLLIVHVTETETETETDGDHDIHFTGFNYDFSSDDVLLGEGSETSMVELKPCRVTSLSGSDPFTFLTSSMEDPTSPSATQTSNEESMKEYSDLKLSLLLYDAVLISIGASVASVSSGENAALAFITGGIGGFLYLLLLQRSVDELPASISRNTVDRVLGQLWGPVSTLALAVAVVFLLLKYSSGENPASFTPKELVHGMAGFLLCKVAVVLAAFKPVSIRR